MTLTGSPTENRQAPLPQEQLPAYDAVVSDVIEVLAPYGGRDRVLPPDISVNTRPGVTATTRVLVVPGLGDLRTLVLRAPGTVAAHIYACPRPDREVGIFRADLVMSEGLPTRIRIDVPVVASTGGAAASASRVLGRTREALLPPGTGQCPEGGTAIDWSHKPRDEHRIAALVDRAWATWVYELVLAPRLSMRDADAHFASLGSWRGRERGSLVSLPLLEQAFGETWTERLLGSYLLG